MVRCPTSCLRMGLSDCPVAGAGIDLRSLQWPSTDNVSLSAGSVLRDAIGALVSENRHVDLHRLRSRDAPMHTGDASMGQRDGLKHRLDASMGPRDAAKGRRDTHDHRCARCLRIAQMVRSVAAMR